MQKTNWIRGVAIGISILGGIGALVVGKVAEIPDVNLYTYQTTYSYNWLLMLSGEIGTAITALLFFALSSIFEQQQKIEVEVRRAPVSKENKDEPTVMVKCPGCGVKQYSDRETCIRCGLRLNAAQSGANAVKIFIHNKSSEKRYCPKCGFLQSTENTLCAQCGIDMPKIVT